MLLRTNEQTNGLTKQAIELGSLAENWNKQKRSSSIISRNSKFSKKKFLRFILLFEQKQKMRFTFRLEPKEIFGAYFQA